MNLLNDSKIKPNNSYETEPSSGSGSSVGENNECPTPDYDNMHLPYLLKPRFTGNSPPVCAMLVTPTDDLKNGERKWRYGTPVASSQESPFEGFGESPFGKLRQRIFFEKFETSPRTQPSDYKPSSGKILFTKFYDTVVGENSSNAMDLQLQSKMQQNSADAKEMPGGETADEGAVPCSDLSFNGRIKSLTLSSNSEEQISLNISNVTESAIDPLECSKYKSLCSPDLFADETDDEAETEEETGKSAQLLIDTMCDELKHKEGPNADTLRIQSSHTHSTTFDERICDESGTQMSEVKRLKRENYKREKLMQHRIRKSLAGLPPPPSVTIPQLDFFEAVLNRKEEILNFCAAVRETESLVSASCTEVSLFKPTHTLEEGKTMSWPDILGVRQHGLSYNLSAASESNELLGLSVVERFIGSETASSYRSTPTSAKKRNTRLKQLTQSPGNRLSHLARRRAVFSSANLATTSQKCCTALGPQILIDKRRTKHRRKGTPKRKTPSSKQKKRKTPSGSAHKLLYRSDLIKPVPSRETSKRALFQSPAKQNRQQKPVGAKPLIKPEIANRVDKSKRALFSPDKCSQLSSASSQQSLPGIPQFADAFNSLLKRKRAADDEDADLPSQTSKLFRSDTLTPRSLKIKSQSFSIGTGSYTGTTSRSSTASNAGVMSFKSISQSSSQLCDSADLTKSKIQRAHSETSAQPTSLTENQRKKLLWAVSQALSEKKITTSHESFKQFASVLARVVRRIFQEFHQKNSTSNSETMLRLAKKYVYNVVAGRSADEIYLHAKMQIEDKRLQSASRPAGYVGPEEYQQRKHQQQLSATLSQSSFMLNCSMENAIDTFGLGNSQASTSLYASSNAHSLSQSSLLERLEKQQLPIQHNPALQNSSSKNNLGGLALRENVDGEQRRSAQKNYCAFTGKDQRNMSPYAVFNAASSNGARLGSGLKLTTAPVISELNASGAKAKRQITFDS